MKVFSTTSNWTSEEFRVQNVAAIWVSWFSPRHSFLFWFKFLGPEPFWKAIGRDWGWHMSFFLGRFGGWVEVFCFRDCLDVFERCKHCGFQCSIKQPAISKVQCLILDGDKPQVLWRVVQITHGPIGSASQWVTSLWDQVKCTSSRLGLLFPVWANFFRHYVIDSEIIYPKWPPIYSLRCTTRRWKWSSQQFFVTLHIRLNPIHHWFHNHPLDAKFQAFFRKSPRWTVRYLGDVVVRLLLGGWRVVFHLGFILFDDKHTKKTGVVLIWWSSTF